MNSEFLASSWKKFHGRSNLNHTPVLCGTVLWVNNFVVCLSTTKAMKILHSPKKYPLYGKLVNACILCFYSYSLSEMLLSGHPQISKKHN